jgi:5,10-methylene-tetrahydrofolate dehydrogenase/methenyl tetrahydrofolate cyclohydrolase
MKTLTSSHITEELSRRLKDQSARLIDRGIEPQLAVILVGDNPDSLRYISVKSTAARKVGIILSLYHIPETPEAEAELKQTIEFLNNDPEVHGVILQLPLPESMAGRTEEVLSWINSSKDVDNLTRKVDPYFKPVLSLEGLTQPRAYFIPPIAAAVVSIIAITTLRVMVLAKKRASVLFCSSNKAATIMVIRSTRVFTVLRKVATKISTRRDLRWCKNFITSIIRHKENQHIGAGFLR